MIALFMLSYNYITEQIGPSNMLTIDLTKKGQRIVLINSIKNNFSIKYNETQDKIVEMDSKEENNRIIITNKTVSITNMDNYMKNISYWLLENNQCNTNTYLLNNLNSATNMEFEKSQFCVFMDSYKSSLISHTSSNILYSKYCHIFENNIDVGINSKIEAKNPVLITSTLSENIGMKFNFKIFTLGADQKCINCNLSNFTFIGGNQNNVLIPKIECTSIFSRSLPLTWIIMGVIIVFSLLYLLMIKTGFFNIKEYFLIGRDDIMASIPVREEEDLLEPIVEHDQDVPL